MWIWALGWEDPLGERNSNPLQYSCLENSMDREHMCLKESDTTEHIIINYRRVQVLGLYILFSSFTFSFEGLADISSIVIFPLVNVSIWFALHMMLVYDLLSKVGPSVVDGLNYCNTMWYHCNYYIILWTIGGDGGIVAKSCPTLATPWTVALQAPLSMGFSRQEYWSGLLFPSPENLPDPGIELRSPALQADSLLTEVWRKPHELEIIMVITNVH